MNKGAFEFVKTKLEAASGIVYGQGAKTAGEEAAWLCRYLARTGQWNKLDALLSRRLRGEPMAYIVGTTTLAGLEFRSDPRSIIPRSFVAEAIEKGDLFREAQPTSLLDLCCGNGNLAIAAATRVPSLQRIVGSDVSADALSLARENLVLHDLVKKT